MAVQQRPRFNFPINFREALTKAEFDLINSAIPACIRGDRAVPGACAELRLVLGVDKADELRLVDTHGTITDRETREQTAKRGVTVDITRKILHGVNIVYRSHSQSMSMNIAHGRVVIVHNVTAKPARPIVEMYRNKGILVPVFVYHAGTGQNYDRGPHRVVGWIGSDSVLDAEFLVFLRIDSVPSVQSLFPIVVPDIIYRGKRGRPIRTERAHGLGLPPKAFTQEALNDPSVRSEIESDVVDADEPTNSQSQENACAADTDNATHQQQWEAEEREDTLAYTVGTDQSRKRAESCSHRLESTPELIPGVGKRRKTDVGLLTPSLESTSSREGTPTNTMPRMRSKSASDELMLPPAAAASAPDRDTHATQNRAPGVGAGAGYLGSPELAFRMPPEAYTKGGYMFRLIIDAKNMECATRITATLPRHPPQRDRVSNRLKRIKIFDNIFDSRLEARWAVFMRLLGVPFQPELANYRFPGGETYTPDFFLPDKEMHLEIKPQKPDLEAIAKARLVASYSRQKCTILFGDLSAPFSLFDKSTEPFRYSNPYMGMAWDKFGRQMPGVTMWVLRRGHVWLELVQDPSADGAWADWRVLAAYRAAYHVIP